MEEEDSILEYHVPDGNMASCFRNIKFGHSFLLAVSLQHTLLLDELNTIGICICIIQQCHMVMEGVEGAHGTSIVFQYGLFAHQ